MDKLDSIAVGAEHVTGNLLPILFEVCHALRRLNQTGESAVIDLMAMPMSPGEESQLVTVLGRGEITAQLDCLGPSEIYETGIAGVWLVTHYNSDRERVGRFLEITRLPTILETQEADIRCGLSELAGRIESLKSDLAGISIVNPADRVERSTTTRTVK